MNDLIGLVTDLSTRLAQVERLLERQNTLETPIAGSGGSESGTSFPGSPSDGDRFWRTDRNVGYFYHAGHEKWLTVTEYQAAPLGWIDPAPFTYAGQQLLCPTRAERHVMTHYAVLYQTIGPAGGIDYYKFTLRSRYNIVITIDTPTPSDQTLRYQQGSLDYLLSHGPSIDYIRWRVDQKVGSPGDLRLSGTYWYRLVG